MVSVGVGFQTDLGRLEFSVCFKTILAEITSVNAVGSDSVQLATKQLPGCQPL